MKGGRINRPLFLLGGDSMKVKALTSFSGIVTMTKGEEAEIKDKETYNDLLNAGYIEDVKSKKQVKADEN